ncbi:ABC transporter ATP-binding protein [Pseudoxanthomonas wuyuanensis]|uniref:ABC-2 type transport system ATP-binding protein n=1 Tax=Pseudoxanthomonas wuyuanensis TaxID=1073196 RepID=A0A286CZ10_9GAMM|nr:ABC transporter ATP-binding protein [Pseudoxanthomonas wuyuanensis]SOD51643.1 ABC-2 type transport system ATP-binding protein [Pseudoxanthomonas wuyuanensis]
MTMETPMHTSSADASPPALQAEALEYRYGDNAVLRGLDLQVRRGEIYALLGGNGAGKSTTLNLFLGFIAASAGKANVCGHNAYTEASQARRLLAYVPESVALYDHLSARENIGYFLSLARVPRDQASVVEPALRKVALPQEAWDRRVAGFSKGMRQKVAIALALARRAPVLLLDEPTSGLDPGATTEFNRLLETLKSQGVAILMVTHDLLGAADVADRIGFLDRGRLDAELEADGPERFDVQSLHRRYALGAMPA